MLHKYSRIKQSRIYLNWYPNTCAEETKTRNSNEQIRGSLVTPVITKLFEYVLLPKLSHRFKQSTLNLVLQKAALCYYRHYLSQNQWPNVNY